MNILFIVQLETVVLFSYYLSNVKNCPQSVQFYCMVEESKENKLEKYKSYE